MNAQKLSGYEWRWALGHPIAAVKIKLISKQCKKYYQRNLSQLPYSKDSTAHEKYLDVFSSGGKADAYRHVFYMAAFTQKVKIKKVRKLGQAHEKTNYRTFLKSKTEFGELPDSLASVMDLFNNEVGFKIGSQNKKLSLSSLDSLVLSVLKSGKALIMKRRKNGSYVDCNNQLLDIKAYTKKWYIPKCLVNSDYVYMD